MLLRIFWDFIKRADGAITKTHSYLAEVNNKTEVFVAPAKLLNQLKNIGIY